MIASIIIRIHPETPNSFEWLTLDNDGLLLNQSQSEFSNLEQHVDDWLGKPLHLLIPGKSSLNLKKMIPAKSQRQIKAAFPYAVEEQFAEDVESLHFAIGNRNDAGEVSALVTNKAMLQGWLKAFDEVGLTPKVVTADHQALPSPADASVLLVSENNSLLKLQSGTSYSIPNSLLTVMLQQFASSLQEDGDENGDGAQEEKSSLQKLIVINAEKLSSDDKQKISEHWQLQIEEDFEQTGASQNELLVLAQNTAASGAINLLQGEFRRRTASSKNWLIWKLPTIAASVFLVMLITVWSLDYWTLNKKITELKQAHITVYKKAFPTETRVIRPVSQMRGKMNSKGINSTSGSFLPLLNKFASALAAVNGTQITTLNFRANKGELKIAFLAPDFATIQKLQAELKAQQLIVTPGASNASGDQYSGRVTIKENN